jgi:N-acetylneuraminic acid mutarotase
MHAHIIGHLHPGGISHHTTVLYNDKLYLYGGCKANCEPNEKMFALDMRSSPFKWEIVEPMPLGDNPKTRDEHSACYYDNSMIIFGGFVNGLRTNQVYRFHFLSKKWELLKPATPL